jgi:integrase
MGVNVREKVKGSGEFWVFISHNGIRKSKKVGDEDTADEVAEKIRAKLVLGDLTILEREEKNNTPTLREFAEQWLVLPNDDWKESTRTLYRFNLKTHVFPKFGKRLLDQISRKDLVTYFNELLGRGLAPRSVLLIRTTMSGVFASALDSELVEANPVQGIKIKGTKKRQKFSANALKEKVVKVLLEISEAYQNGNQHPALLCLLRTGMRLGEVQALKWGDIDFNSRFIDVRRSFRRGIISETKNKRRRQVDMSPLLADTLRELRTEQKKRALRKGRAVPEWVFADREGNIFSRQVLRKVLSKCLEKAGLRRIRIHDLRHTYATIRLVRGHNIGDVSRQLGHSSISITYDTYGDWIPGSFKNEVDELDLPHPSAPYTHPELSEVRSC